MDLGAALDSARKEIARLCATEDMVILQDRILEKEWGWYIPWMARADLEAGYPPAPGISPFIVLRATGAICHLSTGDFDRSVLNTLGKADGEALLAGLRLR